MPVPGYHNFYCRINLSTQSVERVEIPEGVCRQFLGGTGLGTWILLREMPQLVDACDESAPLVFSFSPLVGSPLTTSAKFSVVSKSPLTNRINDSLASSHFAIAGKQTGYDAFVITGQARQPTYIIIDPAGVQFIDATHLWGCTVSQTETLIRDTYKTVYQTAVIGQAGENLVRYATISHAGRHAGRGGAGAVMGSKLLKAIAVAGNSRVQYSQPDLLFKYSKQLSKKSMGSATAKYRELGTVSNLLTFNRLGTLPTRNFQAGTFEQVAAIAPEAIQPATERTRKSCAACTIGCEHIFMLPGRSQSVRMEYENLYALGPLCGISNPETILQASSLCDQYGMDTISTGATIAFAMECAEKGLISETNLKFGDGQSLLTAIESIISQTGLGLWMAKGSRALAEHIGQQSEKFAPHVKGLELPGYEPRALQNMALGFAVGTRGADHNRSAAYQIDFSAEEQQAVRKGISVEQAIDSENEATIMDSMILCKFIRGVFDDTLEESAKMLHMITGWDIDKQELIEIANRIVSAKKLFNIQHGWTPEEDTLPERFFTNELPDGAQKGAVLSKSELQESIAQYNLLRGWDSEGFISQNRLKKLNL